MSSFMVGLRSVLLMVQNGEENALTQGENDTEGAIRVRRISRNQQGLSSDGTISGQESPN
jgi:hypothetical protein